MHDQKNLIIASVVSILILLGFNFLYERPRLEELQSKATLQQADKTDKSTTSSIATAPTDTVVADLPVDEALKTNPRVAIKTDRLQGSISLQGCLIDNLTLLGYHESVDPSSKPITLLSPLGAKAAYYANFGWISTTSDTKIPDAKTLWKTSSQELTTQNPLVLEWDNGAGLLFQRTITLDDQYMFSITDRVINKRETSVTLSSFAQIHRLETPQLGGYMILHEGPIAVLKGSLVEQSYAKLIEKGPIEETTTGGWIGFTDKYWLVAVIPDQKTSIKTIMQGKTANGIDHYQTDLIAPAQEIKSGQTIETTHHLFAGAKVLRVLDNYEAKLGFEKFDLAVDFGWFYFLTKPLFYVIEYLHKLLGNFGLAILALTVLFKVAFFPLANKSYRSMSHMKKVAPKIEALKVKFGDDKLRMNQELMGLYKKEKINPLAGCLPMLIQAPVFFCLYKVLFVTIEMRHAPFYGWIHDLSAPDPTTWLNLFGLMPWTAPAFLSFLSIGAWPLLMGFTMFLQQKLNPQPTDPVQAKMFMLMPIFLTFLLATFPAGLVIYWAWNNILSMGQQWAIMRMEEKRSNS